MLSLITAVLALCGATPEPAAPTAVRLQLERPASEESVLVTCRRAATTCARALTLGKTTHQDDIPWVALAPLVDELASSPLMAASSSRSAAGELPLPLRWQIRLGDRHNRRSTSAEEHRWAFEVVWRVLVADPPTRPSHPTTTIDVERFVQRDPASEVRRVTYRCDADALWCRGEEARWGKVVVRTLEWQRVDAALQSQDGSSLLGANTFTVDTDTRTRRWRWSIQLGDRSNTPRAADHLPVEALRILDHLVAPQP